MSWNKNWRTIKKIGDGGQASVFLVQRKKTTDAGAVTRHGLSIAEDDRGVVESINSLIQQSQRKLQGNVPAPKISQLERQISKTVSDFVRAIEDRILNVERRSLKVLTREGQAAKERFQREIAILRQFQDNRHILSIVESCDSLETEKLWYVAEYHPKGSIDEAFWKSCPTTGSVEAAWDLLRPVIAAVSEMHEVGVVHRDIKCKNVFLADSGDLVLGDPGIAFDPEAKRLTGSRENVASWQWAPHWTRLGKQERPDPTHDVFCLVKLLWCLVSGRLDDDDAATFMPDYHWNSAPFDLREMFPARGSMKILSDRLFSTVLVFERGECKIDSAGELLEVGDKMIGEIRFNSCPYCQDGALEPVLEEIDGVLEKVAVRLGSNEYGRAIQTQYVLCCTRCQTLQLRLAK